MRDGVYLDVVLQNHLPCVSSSSCAVGWQDAKHYTDHQSRGSECDGDRQGKREIPLCYTYHRRHPTRKVKSYTILFGQCLSMHSDCFDRLIHLFVRRLHQGRVSSSQARFGHPASYFKQIIVKSLQSLDPNYPLSSTYRPTPLP